MVNIKELNRLRAFINDGYHLNNEDCLELLNYIDSLQHDNAILKTAFSQIEEETKSVHGILHCGECSKIIEHIRKITGYSSLKSSNSKEND